MLKKEMASAESPGLNIANLLKTSKTLQIVLSSGL